MKYTLIIVDMINEFVYGKLRVSDAKLIIPNIKELVEVARKKGIPVIYAVDSHRPDDSEIKLWGEHAMEGSEASKVVDELKPMESGFIVKKTTYDAFYHTELEQILRKFNVGTVCITGVATSICCQHTAAGAFFRGFKIIVVSDATADLDKESHQKSLEYMKKVYGAKILATKELVERWK
ncbi:MAG: cysteine hydrolase [Candidatus Aenigmarchaeota archaeon]|nr:cysteine hydrolase [Candidatus Aenigmarchaeota archaeon]